MSSPRAFHNGSYTTSGSWGGKRCNIITVAKRRQTGDGNKGYLVTIDAFAIKDFLKHQLNFRCKYPHNPNREWVTAAALTPEEIAATISKIRAECAKATPMPYQLEITPGTLASGGAPATTPAGPRPNRSSSKTEPLQLQQTSAIAAVASSPANVLHPSTL